MCFSCHRATFSLTNFFSEVLRDAAALQDTVRDRDRPLDGIVPDLTLQGRGEDLVLIPQSRAPRRDAATDLHHLGAVDLPIVRGHALGLHTVLVVEGVLDLVGEAGVRPRQDPSEVSLPAKDAAAMLPRSTLPVLDHPPDVPLSKTAVGLGQRLGPGQGQGHTLGPGICVVLPHLGSVLVEVRAPTHNHDHRTLAGIGLGAALLGAARKIPGLHL